MSGWIMSIVGVIVLSVLLDIFMSDGETKKYIRGIIALIAVAVILAPIPKLLNKEIVLFPSFSDDTPSIELNQEYLQRVYLDRFKKKELALQNKLKYLGINGAVIHISIDYHNGEIVVKQVDVDIKNIVITSEDKNIDINKQIKETISSALQISKEVIMIYGSS